MIDMLIRWRYSFQLLNILLFIKYLPHSAIHTCKRITELEITFWYSIKDILFCRQFCMSKSKLLSMLLLTITFAMCLTVAPSSMYVNHIADTLYIYCQVRVEHIV